MLCPPIWILKYPGTVISIMTMKEETIELIDGLLPTIGKDKRKTGTKINFLPDPEIFEKLVLRQRKSRAVCMRRLLNPELTIIFEDRRGSKWEHIVYHEPDGLVGICKGSE